MNTPVITDKDKAPAAGIAQAHPLEPKRPANEFLVAGERYTADQMREANADDEGFGKWLESATPGDVFEQMHAERVECVCPAAATTTRAYVIAVVRNGIPAQLVQHHTSIQAAEHAGLDLLGTCCGIVAVRPLVEMTEAEGARRFPHPLHKDACADAWRGWHERAAADFDGAELVGAARVRAADDAALADQMHRAAYMDHFSGRAA